MKTGRDRQSTRTCWPGCRLDRSTSIGAPAANTSRAGFMLVISGHTVQAAPTPRSALPAITRKSRREPPDACAPAVCECAESAIDPLFHPRSKPARKLQDKTKASMRHPAARTAEIPARGPRAGLAKAANSSPRCGHASCPLRARHSAKRGRDPAARRVLRRRRRHHRTVWLRARRPPVEARGDGLFRPRRDRTACVVGCVPAIASGPAGAAFDQGPPPLSSLRLRPRRRAPARTRNRGRTAGGRRRRGCQRADSDAAGLALAQRRARRRVGARRGAAPDGVAARDIAVSDAAQQQAEAGRWFEELRDRLCAVFEAIEDEYASARPEEGAAGRFVRTPWQRDGGGGGTMALLHGGVFEKAGVNV